MDNKDDLLNLVSKNTETCNRCLELYNGLSADVKTVNEKISNHSVSMAQLDERYRTLDTIMSEVKSDVKETKQDIKDLSKNMDAKLNSIESNLSSDLSDIETRPYKGVYHVVATIGLAILTTVVTALVMYAASNLGIV